MTNLPNADLAVIEPAKVRDYLLSREHPVGRFKCAFFTSLGFERAQWSVLARELLLSASEGEALEGQSSPFGRKIEVRGIPAGPNGRSARVVTIWIMRAGESAPRLVTAFPE